MSLLPRWQVSKEEGLLMFWTRQCLGTLVPPGSHVGVGGMVGGVPAQKLCAGRQTVLLHVPFGGRVKIGLPTTKFIWPGEVWMIRAALGSCDRLHWPPHSYARCAACDDIARAIAIASKLPSAWCDCSVEDTHTLFFSRCSVTISGYSLPWTMLGIAGDTPAAIRNNAFQKAYPN